MDFADIPQYPKSGWEVDVEFRRLPGWVEQQCQEEGLDLNPDFQRGHVWTKEQRSRYVEYRLRGGEGGELLSFNRMGWQGGVDGPYEIIDGLQRLTSVLLFMKGELKAFDRYLLEYTGSMRPYYRFKWRIFELPRVDVLQYYLDMNTAGTPHSNRDIQKVRALLEKERRRLKG